MRLRVCLSLASSLVLALFVASCATNSGSTSGGGGDSYKGKLQYDSDQLLMKNSDQMNDLIKAKMQVAANAQAGQKNTDDDLPITAEPEAITALQDAMRITLSRPDQDGTREALFGRLRRELIDLNAFDLVLQNITKEALDSLTSDASPRVQATYLNVLDNMMAEIKPEISRNEKARRLVESIRDANIKVSDEVRGQQRLQTMKRFVSPSEIAAQILPKKKK